VYRVLQCDHAGECVVYVQFTDRLIDTQTHTHTHRERLNAFVRACVYGGSYGKQ